jgi:hypothetical protein
VAHTFTKQFLSESSMSVTQTHFTFPIDLSMAEEEYTDLSDKAITPGLVYYDPEEGVL